MKGLQMSQTAKKTNVIEINRIPRPDEYGNVECKPGEARKIAVAKFRELADKLERGELDGARVQWRKDLEDDQNDTTELQYITVTRSGVQLITDTIVEKE